jgi:AraC-like DNA-binding protein
MAHFKQFSFKKFGCREFDKELGQELLKEDYKDYIKIVLVLAGGKVTIDFKEYTLEQDALFFVNAGQYNLFEENCNGSFIYYNRDFYCVEIHDKEVACDGILFHNIYNVPVVLLKKGQSETVQRILADIKDELLRDESGVEEMLRILLKQIIILSTRIWKADNPVEDDQAGREADFIRSFSQLVEWHYTKYHTVADYADLLNITPKALNKRITRYSDTTPNELIKNRIILEAKRLLVHTQYSVKEIGYKLGYDDASYFIRLFAAQSGVSPQNFRLQYQPA